MRGKRGRGERRLEDALAALALRRECLDHVIVLGERHLHRIVTSYFAYYHKARTHLSLGKDAPEPKTVQPPSMGDIVELSEVDGRHHRYERRAA